MVIKIQADSKTACPITDCGGVWPKLGTGRLLGIPPGCVLVMTVRFSCGHKHTLNVLRSETEWSLN